MTLPSEESTRRRLTLGSLGMFLACIVAYFPTFFNGFIWDDDRYIEGNAMLGSAWGLRQIWFKIGSEPQYYPLTHTTFWIEYHLWQLSPLGYHIDNLILHAASAILLWRILKRLQIPGGYFAAMIWAVHPLQVESVAWATERKNVLSGLFYFLSLWAYLRAFSSPSPCTQGEGRGGGSFGADDKNPHPCPLPEYMERGQERKSWRGWYIASLFFFFASLLSKSVSSTLPAVILLLSWWKTGRIRARDVWPLVPMFIAGAAMGALTGWMERVYVGAVGPDFQFTHLDRISIAGRAVWFYLWKLIWPAKLSFIYPRWTIDPNHRPWLLIFAAGWVLLCMGLWMLRKRIGRGPLTAALFFVGSLVPALGFVNVFPMQYSFVADHFQFIAGIGPIVLVMAILWKMADAKVSGVIASLLVVILCIASIVRSQVYHDRITLWQDTALKNPEGVVVHNNLGRAYLNDGQIDAAEREGERVMALSPADPSGGQMLIGACWAARGDYLQAANYYGMAQQSMPDSVYPLRHAARYIAYFLQATAYTSLADVTSDPNLEAKDQDLAIADYQQALRLNQRDEWCYVNYAAVLTDVGRTDDAIEQCRYAIKLNPLSIPGFIGIGNANFKAKNLDAALDAYSKVLQIQHDNVKAITNIGQIYFAQGKLNQAIEMYKSALHINPDFQPAQADLEAALRSQGGGK